MLTTYVCVYIVMLSDEGSMSWLRLMFQDMLSHGKFFIINFFSSSLIYFAFSTIYSNYNNIHCYKYRGKGYPALWPSKNCQEPLDVSNDFTFKVIDGILSGKNLSNTFLYICITKCCLTSYGNILILFRFQQDL